ncbi:hypothetical protein JL722_4740 [Aureococcus anophagefferens]|nr:hypothetical protein JL722_4740 [Aureococcus anophagefferens]
MGRAMLNDSRIMLLALMAASASALSATIARPATVADPLVIAGKTFNSRLFLGTGKYRTSAEMAASVEASGAEVVTVAVRRVESAVTEMLAASIDWDKALGQGDNNFVKLEVITDSTYLLPDPLGTVAAARQLVKEGFAVLPYCSPDPILCRHLEDVGCATLGADAVLANSAVARASDAPAMARAFKLATEAGRLARLARPMDVSESAVASSPLLELTQ